MSTKVIANLNESISELKKIFDDIASKKALVVGSGYMIKLAIKYLHANNLRNITLTNRNYEKGSKVAKENDCNYSRLQYLPNIIPSHDIIISCTSSSIPIIGKGMMESCVNTDNAKPYVIIDLGVPRDVESEISNLENVYLYSVDDLGKVIENNYKIREQAVNEAEKIIKFKLLEFKKWLDQNHSDGLVKNYRGYVDDITDGAVIKAKKSLRDGEDANEVISYLARKVYLLSTSNPYTIGNNKNHKPHADNSVHIKKCHIDCREIIWPHQRMLINQ